MVMTIGKLLYALVGKNMLLSTNKGRWTTYSINTAYRQGDKVATSQGDKVATSQGDKVATSSANAFITLLITFFKKIFLFEVFCIDNTKH